MKTNAIRRAISLMLCCMLWLGAPGALAQEATPTAPDATPDTIVVHTLPPEAGEAAAPTPEASALPSAVFPQADLSLAPAYYWESLQALGLSAADVDNVLLNLQLPHGNDQRF